MADGAPRLRSDREPPPPREPAVSEVSSVSVVIPTHNRAEILSRALDCIGRLEPPSGVEVDTLVVANACTDATEPVTRERMDGFPFPLRLVAEPEAGLNVARNRGVRESRGQIVAFLDDDALVEPGWLEALVAAFEKHEADVVAGKVELLWEEVERPPWSSPSIERLLSYLDLGPSVLALAKPGQLVGANFAVRRCVLERLGGFADGLDRSGRDLLSGGDTEFTIRAQRAGYRLLYAPGMAVRHWVAPGRLALRYLDRVARARGRTRVALHRRLGSFAPWPFLRLGGAQALSGGWREVVHRLRGDLAGSRAGRMDRQRGLGTVTATLSTLRPRWRSPDGGGR